MFVPTADGLVVIDTAALWHTGPNAHQVVVASTGQVSAIGGPLEPTHLLGVTGQGEDVMVCHPHIMMVDVS